MKRINREFCLTDESVNCYGYRLLTSGLEIDRYRPPIGFLMHERERGVAVQWTDFRLEGDRLFATPIVNDTLFPDLAQQIEEGFINAASVGHIVALETSTRPEDLLPGQEGPTVTRWFPREVSLVDIPGNYNALGRLYDENDNVLHDLSAKLDTPKTQPMDLKSVFPELADTDEASILDYLGKVKARACEADSLQAELDNLKAQAAAAQVRALTAEATADHKIPQAAAEILDEDYRDRPERLRSLLELLPARSAVPQPQHKDGDLFASLSWEELDHRGLLPRLKAENPDLFAVKFAERFK